MGRGSDTLKSSALSSLSSKQPDPEAKGSQLKEKETPADLDALFGSYILLKKSGEVMLTPKGLAGLVNLRHEFRKEGLDALENLGLFLYICVGNMFSDLLAFDVKKMAQADKSMASCLEDYKMTLEDLGKRWSYGTVYRHALATRSMLVYCSKIFHIMDTLGHYDSDQAPFSPKPNGFVYNEGAKDKLQAIVSSIDVSKMMTDWKKNFDSMYSDLRILHDNLHLRTVYSLIKWPTGVHEPNAQNV